MYSFYPDYSQRPIAVDDAPVLFGAEGHQLCERCINSITIEELLIPGWEYKGKFSKVAEHATSCAICSLIWKISQRHCSFTVNHDNPPHGIAKLLWDVSETGDRRIWGTEIVNNPGHDDTNLADLSPRCDGELPSDYSLKMRASEETIPPSRTLEVEIIWPRNGFAVDAVIERPKVFTNENDSLRELHGLHSIRAMGPSTGSASSLGTAWDWLRRCLDFHPEFDLRDHPHQAQPFRRIFSKPNEQLQIGPSRVLDYFASAPSRDIPRHDGDEMPAPDTSASTPSPHDGRPLHCKLVNFADTDGNYATMSYCWGELDYKAFVTTERNVASRCEFIDEMELPQICVLWSCYGGGAILQMEF